MRLQARHYATAQPVEIVWDNGLIRALGAPSAQPPDVEAGWGAPALFDLQIKDCDGRNFSSEGLTDEAMRPIVPGGGRRQCPPQLPGQPLAMPRQRKSA